MYPLAQVCEPGGILDFLPYIPHPNSPTDPVRSSFKIYPDSWPFLATSTITNTTQDTCIFNINFCHYLAFLSPFPCSISLHWTYNNLFLYQLSLLWECKLHEDKMFVLFTIESPIPWRALINKQLFNSYVLNEWVKFSNVFPKIKKLLFMNFKVWNLFWKMCSLLIEEQKQTNKHMAQ